MSERETPISEHPRIEILRTAYRAGVLDGQADRPRVGYFDDAERDAYDRGYNDSVDCKRIRNEARKRQELITAELQKQPPYTAEQLSKKHG